MKEYIFIEGKKVTESIPLRSLFYGEGLFETFRYKNSLPVSIDSHLDRMDMGASLLKIPIPERGYLIELIEDAIMQSQISDAYVKICLLSGGDSSFYKPAERSQLLVIIKEYASPHQSVRLKINSFTRISGSPLSRIKSLNYLENILARREAQDAGFDDSLFFNEMGEICECSASNIFWYKGNTLYTPSFDCGLLPGTTRANILKLAKVNNLSTSEGSFFLDDIKCAEIVFISNSLIGCTPVSSLEGVTFDINQKEFKRIKNELLYSLKWT